MRKVFLMKKEIIYAFIDGQNLYESLNRKGVVFSYEKLRGYLRRRFNTAKEVIYLGDVSKNIYQKVKRAGFTPRLKSGVKQIDETGKIVTKANIDVDLVVGVLGNYNNKYQKAVILSGDGDFISLARFLCDNGKLEAIIIPNREHSSACYMSDDIKDYCVYLSDIEEKVELLKG